MYKNVKSLAKKITELLDEITVYERCMEELTESIDNLDEEYQNKAFGYEEYRRKLEKILKGRSKKEWLQYYNSYLYFLFTQIDVMLSDIIMMVRDEKSANRKK